MPEAIYLCRPGYENYLSGELAEKGYLIQKTGPGVVFVNIPSKNTLPIDHCFPHFCLMSPELIEEESVNQLGTKIADKFFNKIAGRKIEREWYLITHTDPGITGLGRRGSAVTDKSFGHLKKIAGRISKLCVKKLPVSEGEFEGIFLYFPDFGKVYFSNKFRWYGQKRVSDDPAAPSRSYLKIEEAYGINKFGPETGQTVCDLGAAPGGWSYSAAKRGARVTAVDNGALKGGAKDNPLIRRLAADAFTFVPDRHYDWLFCDMVEHPNMVLKLLDKWIANGWCRYFIVNLKFGRTDPVSLLSHLRSPSTELRKCVSLKIRHLFHDRDEITLSGRLE